MTGHTPGGSTGTIELRDLRVLGVHGALPEERTRSQPFSVDLDVWFDAGPAADSDALEDTVDYGALCATVADTVARRSFRLLEALAAEVADRVLAGDPRIQGVAATVRKVRPPVPVDLGSVGVRVMRGRSGGGQEEVRAT